MFKELQLLPKWHRMDPQALSCLVWLKVPPYSEKMFSWSCVQLSLYFSVPTCPCLGIKITRWGPPDCPTYQKPILMGTWERPFSVAVPQLWTNLPEWHVWLSHFQSLGSSWRSFYLGLHLIKLTRSPELRFLNLGFYVFNVFSLGCMPLWTLLRKKGG